jgi:hypothetical protein
VVESTVIASEPMSANLQTHIATEADYDSILSLTNDAFMADAFFKKAEYHLRCDRPTVKSMMAAPNSRFILAAQSNDNSKVPCGSLFFHWEITTTDTETRVRICQQVRIAAVQVYQRRCASYINIGNWQVLGGLRPSTV